MGLDVYLYKVHMPVEELEAFQAAHEKISETEWGDKPYESYSDDDKNSVRDRVTAMQAALVAERGVPVFDAGSETYRYQTIGEECIERPSEKHPDHLFKVGYFRSSYNDGGINSVARVHDVPSLYDVFEPNDEYHVKPNWKELRTRAESAREKWTDAANRAGDFRVMQIRSFRGGNAIGSEAEALQIFLNEQARVPNRSDDYCYENQHGLFVTGGIDVRSLMIGVDRDGLMKNEPCVYAIVKCKENPLLWYVRAWEIVIETCDYVLSQPDPERFILHWSS